jgi:hypothetical protein
MGRFRKCAARGATHDRHRSMVESRAPRIVPRGGHVIRMLAVASLVSGCVAAATTPSSSQPASSASSVPTKPGAPGASRPPSAPSGSIVAWVDRPASAFVDPTPKPYLTDARPCEPKDLKVSAGDVGAGLGNVNLPVTLMNTSSSTCILKGEPTIGGLKANGILVPLAITFGSYFGDPGPAANIATGEDAALNISGADACPAILGGKHRVYPMLRIGLPGGGGVDAAAHGFDTVCGVSVSQFGVPADGEPVVDPPLSPLTAQISAPTTAAAGQILVYTVTLSNPQRTNVSLRPCPAYDEFVGTGSNNTWVATVLHYYLNCDASPTIPAGASVTFGMRLSLPANQPEGMAKFGWDVQGGGGPWAAAPLTITAAR